ncbi:MULTISPECIES: hypothetical protein [Aureimonas]|uniref:Uncharacterized protein n=1 Tax=Aureimonas pseudogalii TaxID=1744844 RepID=A0A7W6H714_9HYPH|nr:MULTISPECIES: hypothetical protein [Aureimonas]MBB3999716.1 hypothetical protein [Aureimonas pseudogalii]
MPTVLRQIAEASRAAWDHASAILLAARLEGVSRADHDAIADFADEQRDRWIRADDRARREDDRLRALENEPSYFGATGGSWWSDDGRDPFAEPDDLA